MHERTHLIEQRIDRFIRERLQPALYRERESLEATAWEAPGEPVAFMDAATAACRPFSVGQAWGRPWGTTVYR